MGKLFVLKADPTNFLQKDIFGVLLVRIDGVNPLEQEDLNTAPDAKVIICVDWHHQKLKEMKKYENMCNFTRTDS